MKSTGTILFLAVCLGSAAGQQNADEGPTNEKAHRSYKEAFSYLHERRIDAALDAFKRADKQDGGRCAGCQRNMIKYGVELREWKTAETAAEEMIAEAATPKDAAVRHYQFGLVLLNEALDKHKEEVFSRCHEEMEKALGGAPDFPDAMFADGRALAYLKQDDAAKARFEQYVKMKTDNGPKTQRAIRYINDPELARARLAPPFEATSIDGQRISLDDLTGKVVLLDFWATWCEACVAAMPHLREIAKKFEGQPLVVVSISLDASEDKWRAFVAKNEMTWPQCRDVGHPGTVAKLFGVQAIPHTFTIDADGVLQDERIGDASIEGKLKKLIRHAEEAQAKPQ